MKAFILKELKHGNRRAASVLEVYRVLGLKVLGFGVWVLKVLGFMMKVWVPQP